MRRFRFALDPYLDLLKRRLEQAEANRAAVRQQQEQLRRHSEELLRRRRAASAEAAPGEAMSGAQLRGLDGWRDGLAARAAHDAAEARRLEAAVKEASDQQLALWRRVELIERLRSRRLSQHQQRESREAENVAAELHAALRQRTQRC